MLLAELNTSPSRARATYLLINSRVGYNWQYDWYGLRLVLTSLIQQNRTLTSFDILYFSTDGCINKSLTYLLTTFRL